MHEIGIANEILAAGMQEVARHPGSWLVRIGVRVGELSGVDRAALDFAFAALTKGTSLEAVRVEIETVARRARCRGCGLEFESQPWGAHCPGCGSLDNVLIAGDELDLRYIEVEEP
ncbi:MAG TPA: hydrogenase maturation nickel metallochaperone HypA [Acidobacteriaceae bacterium]|nr:hydrogenase maturation nickel metallochaperone HypA [Acidobacteriaceae bacterium]